MIAVALLFTTACEEDDPCELITCLNSGTCVNGACDCAEGFSGLDCSNQITPTSIKITNIRVTRFPPTDVNGSGWDLTSGADIYVSMNYDNENIYRHSTVVENASSSLNYDFVPEMNLNLANPTDTYSISVFDDDGIQADDFLGGIEFTPYSNNNGFPTILSLDANGAVAFELTVEYSF